MLKKWINELNNKLTKRGVLVFSITFLFSVLSLICGCNLIYTVILSLFIGAITEIAYCSLPIKSKKIFGITLYYVSFVELKNLYYNYEFELFKYHNIDKKDFYYCVVAIVLYIIIKILFIF